MNPSRKYLCVALLGVGAAMCGCAREAPNPRGAESAVDALPPPPAAPPEADPTQAPAPVGTGAALSADAALALVAAVDEHEIAAAEQARAKKVSGDVLEYANLLHREHTANLQAGQALAARAGGARSNEAADADAMRKKGRDELAALDAQSGAAYQKAYVDAMVKGHGEVLVLLDTRLIPAATDEQLRTFLTNSRNHVAMHLERGKALQGAR